MKRKLLLFGYGNPDRGDDGAAYHIIKQLLKASDINEDDIFSAEVVKLNENTDILFNFQLLPEYADLLTEYDRVIFIDAHTAEIEEELKLQPLQPNFQYSPFTHHFSPSSCLALAKSLKGNAPQAWLLSIRGYHFGFDRNLSQRTSELVNEALKILKTRFLEFL